MCALRDTGFTSSSSGNEKSMLGKEGNGSNRSMDKNAEVSSNRRRLEAGREVLYLASASVAGRLQQQEDEEANDSSIANSSGGKLSSDDNGEGSWLIDSVRAPTKVVVDAEEAECFLQCFFMVLDLVEIESNIIMWLVRERK